MKAPPAGGKEKKKAKKEGSGGGSISEIEENNRNENLHQEWYTLTMKWRNEIINGINTLAVMKAEINQPHITRNKRRGKSINEESIGKGIEERRRKSSGVRKLHEINRLHQHTTSYLQIREAERKWRENQNEEIGEEMKKEIIRKWPIGGIEKWQRAPENEISTSKENESLPSWSAKPAKMKEENQYNERNQKKIIRKYYAERLSKSMAPIIEISYENIENNRESTWKEKWKKISSSQ